MFNWIKDLFKKEKYVQDYVYLINSENRRIRVNATFEGLHLYAQYYSGVPDSVCTLFPEGMIKGVAYVIAWEPVTKRTINYYFQTKKDDHELT